MVGGPCLLPLVAYRVLDPHEGVVHVAHCRIYLDGWSTLGSGGQDAHHQRSTCHLHDYVALVVRWRIGGQGRHDRGQGLSQRRLGVIGAESGYLHEPHAPAWRSGPRHNLGQRFVAREVGSGRCVDYRRGDLDVHTAIRPGGLPVQRPSGGQRHLVPELAGTQSLQRQAHNEFAERAAEEVAPQVVTEPIMGPRREEIEGGVGEAAALTRTEGCGPCQVPAARLAEPHRALRPTA